MGWERVASCGRCPRTCRHAARCTDVDLWAEPAKAHALRSIVRWQAEGYDGRLKRLHHALYGACREKAGREASPTAAVIDSQSVKGAEKGGAWDCPASMAFAHFAFSTTTRAT